MKRRMMIHIPKGVDFREAVQYSMSSPIGEPENVNAVIIEIDDGLVVEFRHWRMTSLDATVSNTSVGE